jgi:bla regulator protein blaR1
MMRMNDSKMGAVACAYMVAIAMSATAAMAQTSTAGNLPKFDVVSIKPHEDESIGRMGISFKTTPDGISFKGGSLDMLLRLAFDVPRDRLLNEPEWVKSSRFDIDAKVGPEDAPRLQLLTRQQRWAMLIPALEDRCQLKFSHEDRNLDVYALVVAKGGPKLKEVPPSDPDALKAGSRGQPPTMSLSSKGMTIWARDATIESLAELLSQQVGITMVDKTGLTGEYEYTLTWMPDEDSWHLMGLSIPVPPHDEGEQSQQPLGPSIFSALQEPLGLKLEKKKAPVDVIVISHVDRPSAN